MSDKYRRKKEPKHIRLYARLTGSDAWRHLSGNAIKVLIALIARDDGTRNGKIGFSCREAAKVTGLSTRTCWRCLQELQKKGFIHCTEKGGFSRKLLHATLWRYTWVAWPGGKPAAPTHDYDEWRCMEKRGCNICNRAVAESDEPSGNTILPDEESATGQLEKRIVSADPLCAETTTLTVYQGDGRAEAETQQRKQASSSDGAEVATLRGLVLALLDTSEAGEQSRLAERTGIPGGTLSKFLSGRNLPARYREPLLAAVQ